MRNPMEENRYLEMCEAARELQSHFQPGKGDRVFLKENLYYHPDSERLTAINKDGSVLVYPKGFYHINNPDAIGKVPSLNIHDRETFCKFCIYVPYQHQMQQKLIKALGTREDVLIQFNYLAHSLSFGEHLIARYTFEELWLMLYYFFAHKKEWNGNRWIPTEVSYAAKVYAT